MNEAMKRSNPVSYVSGMKRALIGLDIFPILITMAWVSVFFAIYEPKFFRMQNLINVLRNASFLAIISSGQMVALVIGGFDLSVGSVVALSSITAALTMVGMTHLVPGHISLIITVGVVAALITGVLIGVINGLCVSLLRVSPLVVTLGTMSLASGIALYTTTGVPIYGMPEAFTYGFDSLRWCMLPASIYVSALIVAAMWWMMKWTKLGRYIYAIGGNIDAAYVSGIRVKRYMVVAYGICGLLAAVTGVLLTARVGSGEGTMGGTFMMESIAAALLSGVRIGGGVGRADFVAVGSIFLAMVRNGMNIIHIDSKIQMIVVGIMLLVALAFDRLKRRELMS